MNKEQNSNNLQNQQLNISDVSGSALWLCLYQYKGMETEGYLQSNEKFICKADDIIEALYKYHIWICLRENRKDFQWYSLSEYRRFEYAYGGWGFFAYKLDSENEKYRDDNGWFNEHWVKYCH